MTLKDAMNRYGLYGRDFYGLSEVGYEEMKEVWWVIADCVGGSEYWKWRGIGGNNR